ncbi:permease [Coxiella burnetii]|uniref:sulfite exporter TauE/SafE family protein n=1 Tax=Coxiella burnetii TaxID=777 RepID=UPI0000DAE937|nr:sulfite exporter TauE/SafE family protein [Coxiella burnetii]ABX78524.1 putative membrane protein [Coxiella burnetii RSA 331]AML48086.1 permease [Coxiella burnetii]AML54109.1 permease [Coxiella burnetii]ATN68071.1 permease [Coxiella burnetii]ATN69999.1 permease [Coxiella burnetii]
MPTPIEDIYFALLLLFVGGIAGYLGSLFGVGGGIVLVPVFLTIFPFFHVSHEAVMHNAVGTSLALLVPNALLSARNHYKRGNFDFPLLKQWIPFILIGAITGILIIKFIPTAYLKILFALYLYASFLYVILKKGKGNEIEEQPRGWGMRIAGVLIGGFSVLLGMGGGTFSIPFCQAYNYSIKKSIALASATAIFIGLIGTIGVIISGWNAPGRAPYSLRFVNLLAFICILPTIIIFSPFGVKTAQRLSLRQLRILYAFFLLTMGLYMTSHVFFSY